MAASPRPSSTVPPTAAVTPSSAAPKRTRKASGPRLLFAAALVLLIKWLLAMLLGVGDTAHILLLPGLMLVMLAGLKARDAAMHPTLGSESEKR